MASIKDLKKMCKNMTCEECPLSDGNIYHCWVNTIPADYPSEDIDTIVDKWVQEHSTLVKNYAEWICLEPEFGLYYSCSKCGYNTLQGMYKFCPSCGARMKGDK